MSEVVVDTNVWVMVDEEATDLKSEEERQCILACQRWLEEFIDGDDRLVVDDYSTYIILSEYRRNVRPGGVAENLLNELTGRLFHRLTLKKIRRDRDGFAVLPAPFALTHGKDRVFVAVAIQCDPFASIYFATDTDWADDRANLEDQGLAIVALCPDYIQERLREP